MQRYVFILLHGAWHDGTLWEPVASELRRFGHEVHTPTVAGHGKEGDKSASHAEGVASIVAYIEKHNLSNFILVAHSFAGTVASQITGSMPARIRRVVFWNAFVLEHGKSINDEGPSYYRETMRQLEIDGTFMLPFTLWRDRFIQDADLEFARATYALLSPEPTVMFETPLDQSAFFEVVKSEKVAFSYLNATDDTVMPHGEFAWYPRFADRLGSARVVQMPGSHEVMFTNPQLAAAKVLEAGRD
ncbi:alpha/beta fold hydrolase [Mycobacteroides abscessus]